MELQGTGSRARARDAGVARLRRATRITIFGATALAGAFAALAAHSAPGHKAAATAISARHAARRTQQATSTRAQSDEQQQFSSQPATPAVAPAATDVAPVAVTGGS